jgi:hypothetical protein
LFQNYLFAASGLFPAFRSKAPPGPSEPGSNDAPPHLEKWAGNPECPATCTHCRIKARVILQSYFAALFCAINSF